MRAIVMGGARFSGSHMVDLLSRLPADSLLFRDGEYVFHFAGIGDVVASIERPLDSMDANVNGTLAVLEAARHNGHLSSEKKLSRPAGPTSTGISPPPLPVVDPDGRENPC